jgi:uncharacterized protein YqeY
MLEEQLNEDMKAALKAGDQVRLSTLRMLRSQVLLEKKKDASIETLSDEATLKSFASYAKRLRDSIAEYERLGRAGEVARIREELQVVEGYLPKQLSEEEMKHLVKTVIAELGARSIQDLGRVMKEVLARAEGRADGKLASQMVRDSLS